MSLSEYRRKRDLSKSHEPEGGEASEKHPIFVVQKHDATNLHYDFRLEVDGVLWSWAVPKGPSMNPEDKRLAIMVEDHPLDYANFEGTIPKGNYGGGTVMVWDAGIYEPRDQEHPKRAMHLGRHSGKITVVLSGEKLKGEFALVRAPARGEKAWLLIKKRDEYATETDILKKDKSALSKRSLDQIATSTRSWNEGGDQNDPMPHHIKPMLATQVDEPFDDPAWLYEVKWDGYRAVAELTKEGVELYSRNLQPFNEVFAPIVDDLQKIEHTAVLDGEVVVVDEQGRSSFQRLQNYRRDGEADGELLYYVFDLLYLDGRDLTGLPLSDRKALLQRLIPKHSRIHLSEHIPEQGIAFMAAAKGQNLEGIMAKNSLSPYQLGRRSEEWLKVKTIMQQEAVVAGYTEPKGSRKLFGALVLGVWEGDELIYIGHTGGGFDDRALKEVYSLLQPLKIDTSPFKIAPKTNAPVTWVKPKLVVEAKFQEWTGDGHMRKPIFVGLRPDKHPKDVHREKAMSTKQTKSKAQGKTNLGHVELTHLEKVYWPKDGFTKGDLIEYYRSVARYILAYLKDRPESMNRHPDGIEGESFFQKNVDNKVPEFAKVVPIHSESEDRTIHYLVCENEETLLYMANLGCIEINPWNSRVDSADTPDFLVIDLDPEDIGFDKVVEVAQHVHALLEKIGVDSYCKTSGATGLHIYVPLGAKYDYEQAKNFAHLIGTVVNAELPQITSLERNPSKRQRRVYLDYLQNRKGQTLAAPYSVRPRPGATVSTPLEWSEVKKGLDPKKFTIKTIGKRLEKKGDLWKPVLGKGMDMAKALKKLESLGS